MVCRTGDVILFVEKKRGRCFKHDRICDGISGYKLYSGSGTVKP
jgi:hypothetical protein